MLRTAEKVDILDQYYTQVICEVGLQELIVVNISALLITKLEDEDEDMANVMVMYLLQHLKSNAEVMDVMSLQDLLQQ